MQSAGFAYNAQATDFANPYFLHGGKLKALLLDGHVASPDEGSLFYEYYFPFFGRTVPRSYPAVGYYADGTTYIINDATK